VHRIRKAWRAGVWLAAPLALARTQDAAAQQVIWQGRSGGFEVSWTSRDITARRASGGAVVFSARRLAEAEWREMQGDHDDEVPIRELERRYRVISVVGRVLSLEEYTYCDCGGAHPISWIRFVSYDLARGTLPRPATVAAPALVVESDLLRALERDALLRQAMDSTHLHRFTSLAQLTSRLKLKELVPAGDECSYMVGEEFPAEFGFHHLEGSRVAVRFSLSHDVEICRGRMTQVGVLATPSAAFLADLRAASERRAGFLMKDLRAIAGERNTIINFQLPHH
jgi:hypothetical protein